MTTHDRLVAAAAALLDAGGEDAVTLRAVGNGAGLSHNAPYKHFKNRDALLAAVATADLAALTTTFVAIRASGSPARAGLLEAIGALVDFGRRQPARYRLVFSAPALARIHPSLQAQSTACLGEIVAMVADCQAAGALPAAPTKSLASLFLATMHGLVTMEANGLMMQEKTLPRIEDNLTLMLDLLSGQGAR